jgi:hypothetical protein
VQLVGQRYRLLSEQTTRYPAIRTADEACSGCRFRPGRDGELNAGRPDMDVLHRDLPHLPTRSARLHVLGRAPEPRRTRIASDSKPGGLTPGAA